MAGGGGAGRGSRRAAADSSWGRDPKGLQANGRAPLNGLRRGAVTAGWAWRREEIACESQRGIALEWPCYEGPCG